MNTNTKIIYVKVPFHQQPQGVVTQFINSEFPNLVVFFRNVIVVRNLSTKYYLNVSISQITLMLLVRLQIQTWKMFLTAEVKYYFMYYLLQLICLPLKRTLIQQ